MSKTISISDDLVFWLDQKAKKDEEGRREETYGYQLEKLLKVKRR